MINEFPAFVDVISGCTPCVVCSLTECMMKGAKKEAVIPAALATATPRTLTTVGNTS